MTESQEPKGQELVVRVCGEPFRTELAAKKQRGRLGLKDSHQPVTHAGGWALARIAGAAESLPEQSASTTSQAEPAALLVAPEPAPTTTASEPEEPVALGPAPAPEYVEAYHRVVFQDRSNPADQEDVHIGVNGEWLVMQRGKEVIVPQRFLGAADHARYPQIRQLPNQPRRTVGWVQVFPYRVVERDVPKAEYFAAKKAGTQQQKAAQLEQGAVSGMG